MACPAVSDLALTLRTVLKMKKPRVITETTREYQMIGSLRRRVKSFRSTLQYVPFNPDKSPRLALTLPAA